MTDPKTDTELGLEREFDQLRINQKESVRELELSSTETKTWRHTISNVIKSVVSIKLNQCVNLDGEGPYTGEATGFIVDSEKGIIITNRHVVGTGPFRGYAVFDNHEEADLKAIYRDPIHDFGFLQFRPKDIKFMEVTQLNLAPELAKVGTEIRVVGNDNGEKLSIMTGIISRIDRAPPEYGANTYNDFNTEYIQASASLSGGSSGSPVVNSEGLVVAIQAGGSFWASTDYFLPLFRAKRALNCIQKEVPITRGDIQVIWNSRPYGECERLGLPSQIEKSVRNEFPSANGLLCAKSVIPKGPCADLIKEGDILISINDEFIVSLVRVDEILDENVGKELKFTLRRGKRDSFDVFIPIGDLYKITPARYVQVFGSIFHETSYQLAANGHFPINGVVGNSVLYDDESCLIHSIDDKIIEDLDGFIDVLKQIPNGKRAPITYYTIVQNKDVEERRHTWYEFDRTWNSRFVLATRNDDTGLWDITDLAEGHEFPRLPSIEPEKATYKTIQFEESEDKKASLKQSVCNRFLRSLVEITVDTYISLDDQLCGRRSGTGIVLDPENGYVLAQHSTVRHDMCNVFITFGNSVEVSGKIVFMHPHHNLAVLKYDPLSIVADIQPNVLSVTPLKRGEKCLMVGSSSTSSILVNEVTIGGSSKRTSKFFEDYINLASFRMDPGPSGVTGIVCDYDGTIRGVWQNSNQFVGDMDPHAGYGTDITDLRYITDRLKNHESPSKLRIVDVHFNTLDLLKAKQCGVPSEWISKYNDPDSFEDSQFLEVTNSHAANISSDIEYPKNPLEQGDIVLTVDDKIVRTFKDINILHETLSLSYKVLRGREILDLTVPTVKVEDLFTSHLVSWCGLYLQKAPTDVQRARSSSPSGIYITSSHEGSPILVYDLTSQYITEINDQEVKTLEDFVKVVRKIPDNTYVKLRCISGNKPTTKVVRTDYHYFPTGEFKKDKEGKWVEISPIVTYRLENI
ncbi:pro-apoptotic serine protease Nma111p [[Candida] railenensis]|uniref:Pro-apoptotic serine protease NMA111 n=1 Tax=[Candida] railenensis TaxID=45579 RepID=A0A9P0QP29_9ASCO|nr:pro-apoptotic serine protease Nma111p [[Candida] railenensis]